MPIEFAKELRVENPEKYEHLKTFATALYMARISPHDEEFKKIYDYIVWLEDEENDLYKKIQERC